MKSRAAVLALLLPAAVALSACSDDAEDPPTRMEKAAADCDGYVLTVDEVVNNDTEDVEGAAYIIWHPDLQGMQITHADAVNCVFNSLGISDQTRNRLSLLTPADGDVQLYEDGLSLIGSSTQSIENGPFTLHVDMGEQD